MKNFATSLVLLLVVAAIGGWIYFNERGPLSQTGSTVLLRTQPQSVATITVQPATGAPLEITRQSDGWQVHRGGTDSIAVLADTNAVNELLHSVQLVQSSAVVEGKEAVQLQEFGLNAPRGTLIVDNAKIEFGATAPFDPSKIYARITAQGAPQIALVPAMLAAFVNKPFDAWRSKSALRVQIEDVTQLKITSPKTTARFERVFKGEAGEDDQWRMLEPVQARADAGTISALLNQLATSPTPRFLEDDPQSEAKWGLDKPFATIEVGGGAQDGSTLRIGKELAGGARAAQSSQSRVVFVLPPPILKLLARPSADWRDRQMLRFSTQDVQSIRVLARGQSRTLVRDGTNWKSETSEKTSLPQATLSQAALSQAALDILIGLQRLDAEEFNDEPQALSAYGLDKPALEVELNSDQWRAPLKIRLATRGNKVFAQADEGNGYARTVALLPPDAVQAFKLALDALFKK